MDPACLANGYCGIMALKLTTIHVRGLRWLCKYILDSEELEKVYSYSQVKGINQFIL